MSTLTLQRYDKNAHRIMRGDEVVGMALRLGNGKWSLNDAEEKRLTARTFVTPPEALHEFRMAAYRDAYEAEHGNVPNIRYERGFYYIQGAYTGLESPYRAKDVDLFTQRMRERASK